MARLFGAQRLVLQAISDAQGDTGTFIEDSRIAQACHTSIKAVKQARVRLGMQSRRPA